MSTNSRTRYVSRKHDRRRNERQHRLAAAIGAGLATLAAPLAFADAGYTWNANNNGNFTSASSWTGGVAPTGTSDNDALIFGGTASYNAVLDNDPAVIPAFYFGSITFNNSAGIPAIRGTDPTIAAGGLNLRVANPTGSTINMTGAGDANIAVPINIAAGTSLTVNVAAGAGQLSIANFNAVSTLTANALYGEGDIHFNNNSSNAVLVGDFGTLRGDFYVDKGRVVEADGNGTTYPQFGGLTATGGGDVVGNNNLIHVAAGAEFDFNNNAETMSGITGDGTIRLGAAGGLGFNYHGNVNFNGVIVGPTDGTPATGGVTKDIGSGGDTVYTFTGGNSTFVGNTTANAGTMVLGGGAMFSQSKQLTINSGNTFTIDNSVQNIADRFNGTAAVAIAGTLNLLGGVQHFGTFSIGNGPSVINLANGGTMASSTLTRAGRGSFVDFTGNGTFSSTTAAPMINGIVGFATVNGTDWATVDTANGNRIVAFTNYQNATTPTAWAATDNVQNDGTAVAIAANQTINSLKFTGAANMSIASGATLKLAAGGVLSLNGGTIGGPGNINGSQSTSETVFDVQGAGNRLTVSANITNSPSNSVLKYGPGTLTLSGVNTYSNATRVYGGTLEVSSDSNLGAIQAAPATSGASVFLDGGTLRFLASGFTTNRNIQINGFGNVIDTNGFDVTSNGQILGSGGLVKTGLGNLILSGTNGRYTATGDLRIAQGVLTLGSGDLLGGSTIVHLDKGAAIDLSFDADGESAGAVEGDGQLRVLDTAGYTFGDADRSKIVFSGTIDPYHAGVQQPFGGTVTKNSDGDVELSGNSTYTGQTTIDRGSITITANALNGASGPLGNGDSTNPILVGNTAVNNFNAGFYIGKAGVTMGRNITVQGTANSNGGPTGLITIGGSQTNGGTVTFTGEVNANRNIELTAPVGGRVDFTGPLTGFFGSVTVVGGGTVSIADNEMFGGVTVNSSTLLISSDANLGGATNAVNLNGGTLQTSAGFSTSRTINVDSAGATLGNTSTANPLTLTGTLNAHGRLSKSGAGTVQLSQSGPLTLPGLTVNAGTLRVSTGGNLTLTDTLSGTGGLTVDNGVKVAIAAQPTSQLQTIGTLNLNSSGTLDLANHRLQTSSTPAATVRQYLVSAYAGNNWTGSGINSSFVSSNNSGTVKKYALGYAAAGEKNIVPTIPAGGVLVRPTLFGDTNLDGKVDNADISAIIAGGHYLDGTTNNSWAVGDWNYDGVVNNTDVSNLIASGNYLSGQTVNGASASVAAAHASAKLTSASATPAVTTAGVSGDGIPDYVYDPATGDVKFRTDGQTGVQEVHLRSASSQLQPQNMTDPGVGLNGLDVTTPAEIDLFRQGSSGGTLRQFADGYDFQNILPAGLSLASLLQDLTLSYTTNGGGTSNVPATLIYSGAATPEPTSLALFGVAAAGLLSRRRRRS